MISALEAKDKTESLKNEKIADQIKRIETLIEVSIRNCNYEILLEEVLYPPVRVKLEELRYKININNGREINTTISWK